MFKFVGIIALVAFSSAHVAPMSYQQIVWYLSQPESHQPNAWAEPPKNNWDNKPWEARFVRKMWEPQSEWSLKTWEPKVDSFEQPKEDKSTTYEYGYEVHDEKTGDIKRQSETSSNGVVKGQYSLIDSDGFRRVVEYTADDKHGFQATVKREPTQLKNNESERKREEQPKHIQWW